jgi:hypothetical protein
MNGFKNKEVSPLTSFTITTHAYSAVYGREFKRIAGLISYMYRLDIEDAKDVTEESFLRLCCPKDGFEFESEDHFCAAWMKMSKWRGLTYKARYSRHISIWDNFLDDYNEHDGYDFILFVKDENAKKTIKLLCEGYRTNEICKLINKNIKVVYEYTRTGIAEAKAAINNENLRLKSIYV